MTKVEALASALAAMEREVGIDADVMALLEGCTLLQLAELGQEISNGLSGPEDEIAALHLALGRTTVDRMVLLADAEVLVAVEATRHTADRPVRQEPNDPFAIDDEDAAAVEDHVRSTADGPSPFVPMDELPDELLQLLAAHCTVQEICWAHRLQVGYRIGLVAKATVYLGPLQQAGRPLPSGLVVDADVGAGTVEVLSYFGQWPLSVSRVLVVPVLRETESATWEVSR